MAEAMWMDVPIIATRYSGNLDFMDDQSALLIDAGLVPVGADGAWAYPASASWADPDLDQAAGAMRRLATEREFARDLAQAARARIESMSDEAVFVSRFRELFRL
jgi:glycosyltransferase involved in cell wall biosynthesis